MLLKSHLNLIFELLEFAHDLRVASFELVLFRLNSSHLALILTSMGGVVIDHLLQGFVLIVHLSQPILDLLPQLV